ncbi:Phosphatidylinositol 4 [Babesia sp. Xinjiang]|uniref:Phosphatidylinositol 4 n=1 Tax=Babesia sp. Xinjiang TaxID=462227 RepID=UPI000A24AE6A|nr:Phosphatidylinositol 4 [Babesia sp. Xinjiang]ORM39326.1 Phosphatidylinositol 4 [Babesia sp. Xinjiang]
MVGATNNRRNKTFTLQDTFQKMQGLKNDGEHGSCNSTPTAYSDKLEERTSPLKLAKPHQRKKFNYVAKADNHDDHRDLSSRPIRIFVGTWNCAYQDGDETVILKPPKNETSWTKRVCRPVKTIVNIMGRLFNRLGNCYRGGAEHLKNGIGGMLGRKDHHNLPHAHSKETTNESHYSTSVETSLEGLFNENGKTVARDDEVSPLLLKSHRGTKKKNEAIKNNVQGLGTHNSKKSQRGCTAWMKRHGRARKSPPLHDGGFTSTEIDTDVPVIPMVCSSSLTTSSGSTTLSKIQRSSKKLPMRSRKVSTESGMHGFTNFTKDKKIGPQKGQSSIMLRRSTRQLKPLTADDKEPLSDWIPRGYDIYIVSLQETLSCTMFVSITKYLERHSSEPFVRVPLEHFKLSGRGDGALLHTKSTSIAVWVRKSLLDSGKVYVGGSKTIPLSRINRSKGVVSFQMCIFGHIIGVVGCHLPTNYHAREKAAEYMVKKLCNAYGTPGASLDEVFHHIIWTGDFNFRVTDISPEEALTLLNTDRVHELFYHDEFYNGRASTFAAMKFEEGTVRFLPTYKMRDDRDVADYTNGKWADVDYQTRIESHWYKGCNVEERVPSWTDRVIKWSLPELRTCLLIDHHTYRAVRPTVKNILMTSDHSPVGCCFGVWPVRNVTKLPPRKNQIFSS